jgi:hypothetical protein
MFRAFLFISGAKLLKCRTLLGYTPVDLAETDEMREILETKDFCTLESPYKSKYGSRLLFYLCKGYM